MFESRWKRWLLLFLFCELLGLIDALRSYISAYRNGKANLDMITALRWDLSAWLFWVFFIPVVIRLSRRFPINRASWYRNLPVHFAVGLLLAIGKTLFPFIFQIFFFEEFNVTLQWFYGWFHVLVTDLLTAFFFYALVVVFGHALTYYRQYREEELRTSQLQTQLANAQLEALKMQLQPHFLFNTLHSISALQFEDVNAAQKMTSRLGDFLRLTLENTNTQIVSLKREMEFLQCYLAIESIRFGKRLTTKFEIDKQTLDAEVPNLILQPLVENAIKHGISKQLKPGIIRISSRIEKDRLHLEIADNGGSFDNNGNSVKNMKKGVGLRNTFERLQQLYGKNHDFKLEVAPEGGLLVVLDIPLSFDKKALAV